MNLSLVQFGLFAALTGVFLPATFGRAETTESCQLTINVVAECQFVPVDESEFDAPHGIASVSALTYSQNPRSSANCTLAGQKTHTAQVKWSSFNSSRSFDKGTSFSKTAPVGDSFAVQGLSASPYLYYEVTSSERFLLSNSALTPQNVNLRVITKNLAKPRILNYILMCPNS